MFKKRLSAVLLAFVVVFALLLTGCGAKDIETVLETAEEISKIVTELSEETADTETALPETDDASESDEAEEKSDETSVVYGNSYSDPYDVADYIHLYNELPPNYITKSEAEALGWDSSKGNLWDVAEGCSIGGDRFGNREGLLPSGGGIKYTECDVNYEGGYRGAERIIFSNDGSIYYTDDHYASFTQLY